MDGRALRIMAKELAGTFLRRHPSAKHLRDELEQEAAVAILLAAGRYRPGTQDLKHYCYLPVLHALQQHCAKLGRVVGRARSDVARDFLTDTGASMDALDGMSYSAPQEDLMAAREATEVVTNFVDSRMSRVGNTKANRPALRDALINIALGDSKAEAARAAGITRQRMQQFVDCVQLEQLC